MTTIDLKALKEESDRIKKKREESMENIDIEDSDEISDYSPSKLNLLKTRDPNRFAEIAAERAFLDIQYMQKNNKDEPQDTNDPSIFILRSTREYINILHSYLSGNLKIKVLNKISNKLDKDLYDDAKKVAEIGEIASKVVSGSLKEGHPLGIFINNSIQGGQDNKSRARILFAKDDDDEEDYEDNKKIDNKK